MLRQVRQRTLPWIETAATDAERGLLRRALALAEGGRGAVSPNPLVGAIVAREGEVVGEGFHAALGGVHAEVAAIADARRRGRDPRGATMLVTLEPCAHRGRQPPCSEAILAAGISRVVIASEDPSEKASGRGPGILRESGVEVVLADGTEAAAARLLNQPFRKLASTGRPHVIFKAAASLDGFTATEAGDSRWISGAESRTRVHRWRGDAAAVAVGISTALADDPLLTARDADPPAVRQPARVVFDSAARLPLDSKLVGSLDQAPLYVIVESGAGEARVGSLREAGAEVIETVGDQAGRLVAALDELGARGLDSILLEGGARLAGSFLAAGEIDEVRVFVAPLLLGKGLPLIALGDGSAPERVEDADRAIALECEPSGEDVLVRARLREW